MKAHDRILVALDTPDADRVRTLARALVGKVGGFKVGLELFSAHGPTIVKELCALGVPVFLDLKLHDIPNTVAGAAAAAGRLGVTWLTVHALGGPVMIGRAAEAASESALAAGHPGPTILAVTVLTSHSQDELTRVGVIGSPIEAVLRLSALARDSGAGGVVCSPLEVSCVRTVFPGGTLVVPGIRPATSSVRADDQHRTATPSRAVALGADRIVVGRPITAVLDPVAAATAIAREIEVGDTA